MRKNFAEMGLAHIFGAILTHYARFFKVSIQKNLGNHSAYAWMSFLSQT
jgi:hypothetical protein